MRENKSIEEFCNCIKVTTGYTFHCVNVQKLQDFQGKRQRLGLEKNKCEKKKKKSGEDKDVNILQINMLVWPSTMSNQCHLSFFFINYIPSSFLLSLYPICVCVRVLCYGIQFRLRKRILP